MVRELLGVSDRGIDCACCTVIATRGSTPQEAGAMMLVFPDGRQSGTLGGGCVEAEVKRRALAALANRDGPSIHQFELDGDAAWDNGLICGGLMTILVDPVGKPLRQVYRRLHSLLETGHGFTAMVALPDNAHGLPAGEWRILDDGGDAPASLLAIVRNRLSQRPRAQVIEGVAVIPSPPRIRLIIVGAGHVGQAVARLAAETGFAVWVLDDRETYANAERFPHAERRIVGDIGRELQRLKPVIDGSVYCLIVTRGHNHDGEALYHLASSAAGYIGMIGSQRKVRLTFEELLARGVPQDALDRVHAPVGLPIGSQTVPEIAVSIVAELIACRSGAARGMRP